MDIPSTVVPAGGVSLLFTTALEIFSGVESAAQFSEIDEVLRVKTEVVKVRLIIWGLSIGLDGLPEQRDDKANQQPRHRRSQILLTQRHVQRIKISEDSEKLKDGYGLIQRANKGPMIAA
ncbi:hypothetical protein GMDG_04633 [Pseudogymnoascus destructans 20631-21]|uniref:Prion-inhibition and propagation HeLo domain-containing protein n=1 Tax=Pseudogymnoascus destructans (strain ATCC MYA-4855 / 20631-21) TaxID=658429 RepID=L8GAK5_PSED2|nr:hypothetical protein GMDG_04633 [Pseudogymnoascus destructans 20631-21]